MCMPQVTIYLDDQTAALVESAVKKSGLSKSRWIAEAVKEKSGSEWPQAVRNLAGAWKDFPTAEEIRQMDGIDVPREQL